MTIPCQYGLFTILVRIFNTYKLTFLFHLKNGEISMSLIIQMRSLTSQTYNTRIKKE